MMFTQAGLAVLLCFAVLLIADDFSGELVGHLTYELIKPALGLLLCRKMWHRGLWNRRLVIILQAFWILSALGTMGNGDPKGVTQLILPILAIVFITRPGVKDWFQLPPDQRAPRHPLLRPQRAPMH
ncbi:hypothetical protein G5C51_42065 [Streptomyces sp. A7024]|uniref:Uncharacterized protein n=1 Tax=Streptomyces coryli TaxID=1128680 RepID=A0A6G4UF63_9ACTN|nr:hypothetical protein [Streptomyces coryli]NGN70453.1 hypothetical protein [Streptomyces coryli]